LQQLLRNNVATVVAEKLSLMARTSGRHTALKYIMKVSKEFIELNVRFAQYAAQVKRTPLDESLLKYTHLYLALGLGRDFDATNDIWRAYVAGLQTRQEVVDWTYRFYLDRHIQLTKKDFGPAFGCFYCALWSKNRVRLHFWNGETTDKSPLSSERRPQRVSELTAMLRLLKDQVPDTATLIGGSWLYNLEAYRRLFPEEFLETAVVAENDYQFIALWGQFVDRHGEIRHGVGEQFLARLTQRVVEADLEDCFPYQVLRLECPVQSCYQFYGIT
jgi:hypothetical protein